MDSRTFSPFADTTQPVTEYNFNTAMDYCLSLAKAYQFGTGSPALSPDAMSALAIAFGDSGLAESDPAVRRMMTRICFETLMADGGGRYNFEYLKKGDSIYIDRPSESRVRQGLMRFRARQPLWSFTIRSLPINPHLMVLTRTA